MGIEAKIIAILSGIGSVIWNFIENIVIKPPTEWVSYIVNTVYPNFVNTIFHFFGKPVGIIVLLVIGLSFLVYIKKKRP